MLKVKKGDKVVVERPDTTKVQPIYWAENMDNFVGKSMTVDSVDLLIPEQFSIKEGIWWFHTDWVTYINGVPVDKIRPTRQDYPYENWKMSISKDKFVRCITPLADDGIVVEGVYGYVDKVHNKFYYNVYDGMDKYIVADVYATDKGYEFVRENKDRGKVSGVEEARDIMDAVAATREGILASFGLPTDTPVYNPVKNISRNKFLRCVDMCKEKVVFNNLDGSNTYWMDKSPCGKYYYWDGYNRRNKVIYFRGEVDWVEKNYRKDNPEQRKELAELVESLKPYYDKKDPVIVAEEDHEDYWKRIKSSGGISASLGDNVEVVTDPAVYKLADSLRKDAPIKSDGGKSDYYKIILPDWIMDKQKENGYIMLEDLAEIIFDNDFNFTNVFKAQKRMFELKKGRGKAGNDFEYDAKKCHYYVDKQVEVEGRK